MAAVAEPTIDLTYPDLGPGAAAPDWALVSFDGELDLGRVGEIRARIEQAAAGGRVVLVDLGGVEFMDSAALGTLITLTNRIKVIGGGDMRLAAPSQQVANVLRIGGLCPLLRVYPTLETAVADLTGPLTASC